MCSSELFLHRSLQILISVQCADFLSLPLRGKLRTYERYVCRIVFSKKIFAVYLYVRYLIFIFFMQVLIELLHLSRELRLTVASAEKMEKKPDRCFKGHTINNIYVVILVSLFPVGKGNWCP